MFILYVTKLYFSCIDILTGTILNWILVQELITGKYFLHALQKGHVSRMLEDNIHTVFLKNFRASIIKVLIFE